MNFKIVREKVLRKIIHIDLDCFFAAIEITENPAIAEMPVAVCHSNERSGAVCTCNYVARSFGIRSAMSVKKALVLCPQLIIIPANIPKYKAISEKIIQIYLRYTDVVEPISLDEAYLDVTNCTKFDNIASSIAQDIQRTIKSELGLSASAGVAPNKFLAKIASDWHKPGGLFVIKPAYIDEFVRILPVEKLPGIGAVTAQKLYRLGVMTCEDIRQYSSLSLIKSFGILGRKLIEFSLGKDDREVNVDTEHKSVSIEQTFAYNIKTCEYEAVINSLYKTLLKRLEPYKNNKVNKQFIRVRFNNFALVKRERKVVKFNKNIFSDLLNELSLDYALPKRLIGIGVCFDKKIMFDHNQMNFFR